LKPTLANSSQDPISKKLFTHTHTHTHTHTQTNGWWRTFVAALFIKGENVQKLILIGE
jgi:hypothetical protein